MITRSILAAAIAAALTTSAAAQGGRIFDAWGHRFDVPNWPNGAGPVAAARKETQGADRFDAPRRSYVSGPVDTAVARETLAPAATARVIGVWGARIEASAR